MTIENYAQVLENCIILVLEKFVFPKLLVL